LSDLDRPLNPRGERAAGLIAGWLADSGIGPQVVVCSPALRTRQTLDLVRPALAPDAVVTVEPGLYGAEVDDVIGLVHRFDDGVGSAMVIGHNPTLHELAFELTGAGDIDLRAELADRLPTGALVVFDFEAPTWSAVGPAAGRLAAFVRPRLLE
jgi:phosphohistidine phosphatase